MRTTKQTEKANKRQTSIARKKHVENIKTQENEHKQYINKQQKATHEWKQHVKNITPQRIRIRQNSTTNQNTKQKQHNQHNHASKNNKQQQQ